MALPLRALPVWLLLAPRDYLSTFVKLGTIALLARRDSCSCGPTLHMPPLTRFIDGTGPIFAGKSSRSLHHHCVRRDQRLSLADFQWHDSEI